MPSKLLLAVATSLALAACSTVVPVGMTTPIDPDTAPSCARACEAVKMKVAAIVFIRNMGGCVCETGAAAATPAAKGAATSGLTGQERGASAATLGGAALVVIEEEQQRQQQQQQSTPTIGISPSGAGSMHH